MTLPAHLTLFDVLRSCIAMIHCCSDPCPQILQNWTGKVTMCWDFRHQNSWSYILVYENRFIYAEFWTVVILAGRYMCFFYSWYRSSSKKSKGWRMGEFHFLIDWVIFASGPLERFNRHSSPYDNVFWYLIILFIRKVCYCCNESLTLVLPMEKYD